MKPTLHILSFSIAVMLATGSSSMLAQGATRAAERPERVQTYLDEALEKAVEKSDRQRVITLLNQGANINEKWINQTPLQAAIFQQDVEMVKLLLDRGAKINPHDLADAAHGAQGDKLKASLVVKLLLAKGADARVGG
jgi:hypothetical protein